MIGRTIAHYEIVEKLGEGGMGVVYKARDTHLDRFVAIKVLPPGKVANPERRQRFVREAKAASALNHPNIVTIHDIASEQGVHYIAMEYIAGKTLDELIPGKGMRLAETLKYAMQIADALAAAHEAAIVHRDLKPSNVMVTEKGLVKVLDFGLAKLTEAGPTGEDEPTRTLKADSAPHTIKGTVLGTVYYMSPEQAEGKEVEARSDIFSFGSLLYEMVTGRRAFRGETNVSTLAAIIKEEPAPLSAEVPHDLEKLITRCLRKDRDRRIQHMDDVKLALEDLKEESDSGKLAVGQALPPAKARARRAAPLLGVVALAIALAAGGWLWLGRPGATAPEAALAAVPLTTYVGSEYWPTFSPDGSQVAFCWNGENEDNYDIYVKMIGAGRPLRLTTDPATDASPAWSPDGRSIAFWRALGGGKSTVFLTTPHGPPERKLTELSWGGLGGATAVRISVLAWHPSGEYLAIADRDSPEEPCALFLLSIRDRKKRRLTTPSPEWPIGDWGPAFSPDGRKLVFARFRRGRTSDLCLLNLSEDLVPIGDPERLTFENQSATGPVWTPNGKEIVFAFGGYTAPSLGKIPASGAGRPQRLGSVGEDGISPAISGEGNRLAYARARSDLDIWRIDIGSAFHKADPPVKLIASTRWDQNAQFSPDGRKIVFRSDRSGDPEIWVCDTDGSNPVQLTSFGGPDVSGSRWSPDGKWIALVSAAEGNGDVYVVSSEGGAPRRVTTDESNDTEPSWSPDGKWIYFRSTRSGQSEVWRIPAEGGQAVQMTEAGGRRPLLSSDGRFLYYAKLAPGPDQVWKAPVEGGKETQILASLNSGGQFAVVDRGIYFIATPDADGAYYLNLLDFASGETREVAALPGSPGWGLSVSPDGRHILYTQSYEAGSDLMLVENFR